VDRLWSTNCIWNTSVYNSTWLTHLFMQVVNILDKLETLLTFPNFSNIKLMCGSRHHTSSSIPQTFYNDKFLYDTEYWQDIVQRQFKVQSHENKTKYNTGYDKQWEILHSGRTMLSNLTDRQGTGRQLGSTGWSPITTRWMKHTEFIYEDFSKFGFFFSICFYLVKIYFRKFSTCEVDRK